MRASILVTLDNNLPADERNDDCNKYWEAEEKVRAAVVALVVCVVFF